MNSRDTLFYKKINTPIGNLLLISDHDHLLEIRFNPQNSYDSTKVTDVLLRTERQLQEYFKGKRRYFELAYKLDGTIFQKQVWNSLIKIPYGKTISYKTLAKRVGNKNKARAVGNANGKNPIPIIIPCHRVIANDGSLGGYGGGLEIKNFLLKLEQNS